MINLFSGTGRVNAAAFRTELVATLFASVTSLSAGVIGAVFLCTLIASRMGDPLVSGVSLAIGLIGVARIVLSCAYLRRWFGPAEASSSSLWEIGYAAGAWLFSSLVGLLGAIIITRSTEVAMQAAFVTFALCYAAAAASRNAARPLIAYGQVFAMVPIACALMIDEQLFFRILSVLILLYLVAMVSVVNNLHGFLVQSHAHARDKFDLAEKLDAALDHMDRGLIIIDQHGAARFWNQRFAAIFDIPPATSETEIKARQVRTWLLRSRLLMPSKAEALAQMVFAGTRQEGPFDLRLRDGRVIEMSMRPLSQGTICLVEDVTAARYEVDRINRLARTDALTGLSNRMDFQEVGTSRLHRDLANGQGSLMCCLDLDGFKRINDTYGHPVGDRLLQLVADRLMGAVGPHALVARLGGDEFVILTKGQSLQSVAERIIGAFSYPFVADGVELSVGTSVGMAQAPFDGKTVADLMSNADLALYEAKSAGRNCWRAFEPAQRVRQDRMAQYDKKLRAAVEEAKVEVQCQTVLTSEGSVAAVDFTAHWHDDELGTVGHEDLAGACAAIGLSGTLDEQVIAKACTMTGRSQRNSLLLVPLSRQSLETSGLSFRLLSILQHSGVRPGRLVLAVDETVLSMGGEALLRNIADLRACGIKLALDGFGAGTGGLNAIQRFAPDIIRFKAGPADDGAGGARTALMLKGLVALAATIGVPVIAQGIETPDWLAHLPLEKSLWAQGDALAQRVGTSPDQAFLRRSEARIAC